MTTKIEALQVFNGVMLGDGGIMPHGDNKARFDMVQNSGPLRLPLEQLLAYLALVGNSLTYLGIILNSGYPKIMRKFYKGELIYYCKLTTRSSYFLACERIRWYSNNTKVVPKGLVLSPVTLAHWFMNDGNSYRQLNSECTIQTSFATYCFDELSIAHLEHELLSLGIGTYRTFRKGLSKGASIRLYVLQESVDKFMGLIEPFMVEPFLYKIKYKGGKNG